MGYIQKVGAVNNVEMQQTANGSFFVFISEDELKGNKNEITIELYIEGELIDQVTTNFLGPIKSKK